MKSFKHFELELMKIGKVSRHSTKIRGKKYNKGKVYLSNDAFTNKDYELYDIWELSIEEVFSTIKGRGLLIFFPQNKRKKRVIGQGKDFYSQSCPKGINLLVNYKFNYLLI